MNTENGLRDFIRKSKKKVKKVVRNTSNNYNQMHKQAAPDAKASDANYRNAPKTVEKWRKR